MRILVTGATGFIGSLLIPRLQSDGHDLLALARDPTRVGNTVKTTSRDDETPTDDDTPTIAAIRGDLLTGEGLERAMDGVDVAYYLIHSMETLPCDPGRGASPGRSPRDDRLRRGPDPSPSFTERERHSATLFATEARHAGVQRIVYLGGTMPPSERVSRHLRSRAAVGQILTEAVPETVTLRASIVIGAQSRSFRFLVHLVERLPILTLPSWRDFRSQPIDSRDVIAMLASAATEPAVAGQTLDMGGPEVLSYAEIIALIADLMLVHRPTLDIPLRPPPLIARIAARIAREDPNLVLPLMESLGTDLLADPPSEVFQTASRLGARLHSIGSAIENALREWEAIEPLAAR